MNSLFKTLFLARDARGGGFAAAIVLGLIVLGCTCNKDLANLGKDSDAPPAANASNTSRPSSTTDDDDADSGQIPADITLQQIVKDTTADFAYAIENDDFSEIYSKSAPDFQKEYSEKEMREAFKTFIDKKRLILPSITKAPETRAEFSPAPMIRTENGLEVLVLNGRFPTKPFPVKFEYEYVKRDGEWKMLKLVINM
jgi:hypothetical protein